MSKEMDPRKHHGQYRERRQKGYPIGTSPRPSGVPDKRKSISKAIKEKEASLKRISIKNSSPELDQLEAAVARDERQKWQNKTEIEKNEEEIKSLGLECTSKTREAHKLMAGVRHTTEEGIDEAVSNLKLRLCSRDFAPEEERQLQQEIESLLQSKQPLRDYHLLKEEIDKMRVKQETLRSQKEALQQDNAKLWEKIDAKKDLIAKKKEELEESRKEALANIAKIKSEINDLKKQHKQLHDEVLVRQQLHSIETGRGKRMYGKIPSQRPVYHQEIKECKALIVYVQNLSHAPSDTPPSPNPLRPKVDQSSLPAGEFLPRKGEEEGGAVLIPAVTRKKSKRDKRRHTVSAKAAGRTLNHNAITLCQFTNIGLSPPMNSFDIEHVLGQLQEKLEFFTIKSQSGDSGRDSGVALSSTLSTPLSASVENLALLPSTLLPFPNSDSSERLKPENEPLLTDSGSDKETV